MMLDPGAAQLPRCVRFRRKAAQKTDTIPSWDRNLLVRVDRLTGVTGCAGDLTLKPIYDVVKSKKA